MSIKKLNPEISACNKHVRVNFIIESATTLNTFHLIVTTYSTTTLTSLKIDQCCYNGEEDPVYSSKPESLHSTPLTCFIETGIQLRNPDQFCCESSRLGHSVVRIWRAGQVEERTARRYRPLRCSTRYPWSKIMFVYFYVRVLYGGWLAIAATVRVQLDLAVVWIKFQKTLNSYT